MSAKGRTRCGEPVRPAPNPFALCRNTGILPVRHTDILSAVLFTGVQLHPASR